MSLQNNKTNKKIKTISGIALADSKNKTVKFQSTISKSHPMYLKRFLVSRNYLVETNIDVKKGQKIVITSSRPISKKKSWRLFKVIE